MSNKVQVNGGGVSFVSLLTILFIGLKLTGYIDWGWLWVLSPLWISGVLAMFFLFVFFVFFIIAKGKLNARR